MHRKKYIATDFDTNPGQIDSKVKEILSPERIKVEETMRQYSLSQEKRIEQLKEENMLLQEKNSALIKIIGSKHFSMTTDTLIGSTLNRKIDGLDLIAKRVNQAKDSGVLASIVEEI